MTEQQEQEVTAVKPGDAVKVVDGHYVEHLALVTCVHGTYGGAYIPCINVVYVSTDDAKRDPYGQQVERMTSLQHYSQGPNEMTRPGRYWLNV